MDKKCKKYEQIFVFRDETELSNHLNECEDCRAEQKKMDKVSELLKEVKPYYSELQRNSFNRLKIACIVCLCLFTGLITGYFSQISKYSATSVSYYNSTETTNEYGIPVDNYGLINIADEF